MPPTIRSFSTGFQNTFANTATITLPATIEPGDLIVVFAATVQDVAGNGTLTGGFTHLSNSGLVLGFLSADVFWKVAVGNEDGTNQTYDTPDTAITTNWVAVAVAGGVQAAPAIGSWWTGVNQNNQDSPAVNLAGLNAPIVLRFLGSETQNNAITAPSGTTLVASNLSGNGAAGAATDNDGTGELITAGWAHVNPGRAAAVTVAVGVLGNNYTQTHSGAVPSAAAVAAAAAVGKAGTVASAGAAAKAAGRPVGGAVASSGALVTVKAALLALAGTVAPAGAVARSAVRVLAGTVASTGTVARSAARNVAGTVASSGAVASLRVTLRAFAGTVASAGAVQRTFLQNLAGTVASSGALSAAATIAVNAAGWVVRSARVRWDALAVRVRWSIGDASTRIDTAEVRSRWATRNARKRWTAEETEP